MEDPNDNLDIFEEAASLVASGVSLSLSDEQKLNLYGLYKQATRGVPTLQSKPGLPDVTGTVKYKAWAAVAELSREQAREMYIALVQKVSGCRPGSSNTDDGYLGLVTTSGYSSRPVPTRISSEEAAAQAQDVHTVARSGDAASLRALLSHLSGYGPAACTHKVNETGETPLHAAADGANVENVQVLIEAGADLNATETEAGQTPLHYACMACCVPAALCLLRAGCVGSREDADGRTAWDYADRATREGMEQGGWARS